MDTNISSRRYRGRHAAFFAIAEMYHLSIPLLVVTALVLQITVVSVMIILDCPKSMTAAVSMANVSMYMLAILLPVGISQEGAILNAVVLATFGTDNTSKSATRQLLIYLADNNYNDPVRSITYVVSFIILLFAGPYSVYTSIPSDVSMMVAIFESFINNVFATIAICAGNVIMHNYAMKTLRLCNANSS